MGTTAVTELKPGDRVKLSRAGGWYEVLDNPKRWNDQIVINARNLRSGRALQQWFKETDVVYGTVVRS